MSKERRAGAGPPAVEVLGQLQAACVRRNTVPCEQCGKMVAIGTRPSCPHEQIGVYSFKGNFR